MPSQAAELRSPVVTFAASRVGGILVGNGPDGNGFANSSLRLAINPVGTLVVSQLLSGPALMPRRASGARNSASTEWSAVLAGRLSSGSAWRCRRLAATPC
ncbi:hypothetical protein [Leucobacter coleopterorum]|uniref:hypothetical protein n=1 Tax=Leucobacter coleopterorum TaxID=2714933 RepID=UPI0019801F36|nr:hypothetical protein [Leucobacter coleopterorum]